MFDPTPQFGGNCLPAAPQVTLNGTSRVKLTWSPRPNATAYAGPAGSYRIRGLDPLGAGAFKAARRGH